MATRKPDIGKIDTEISVLAAQRKALEALADAAILNDFMISLCEDPAKVEAYKKDPEAFVRNAGLPEHLVDLVVSGGRYAFRFGAGGGILSAAILKDREGGETVVVVVIIVIVVIL